MNSSSSGNGIQVAPHGIIGCAAFFILVVLVFHAMGFRAMVAVGG